MEAQTPGSQSGEPNQPTVGVKRLLQVLADTESSDRNSSALQLHRSLPSRGWDVRTLALAPGRSADLASTIPVMAPSRRSLATVNQFRTEQAWSDVVLLRGLDCAGVARAAGIVGNAPKRILALSSEPRRWAEAGRMSRFDRFLVHSVDSVVVNSESDLQLLEHLDPTLRHVRWIDPHGGSHPVDMKPTLPPEVIMSRWLDCLNTALPSRP